MKNILFLILMAFTLTSSGFEYVTEGQTLWVSQNVHGEVVIVSLNSNIIGVNYKWNDAWSQDNVTIEGTPSQVVVTGCGNYVSVVTTIKETNHLLFTQFNVPIDIACGVNNSVYIPAITR